jgi:DNA repair protein Swi5/Sae3
VDNHRSGLTSRNPTDPAAAVKRHIKLLHEYNEIRDAALEFVGKIAEKEQCRAIDVLKEYDMDEKD